MCNTTHSIFYNCNNNINVKTMSIFVISILLMIISLIIAVIMGCSKPRWTLTEIERMSENQVERMLDITPDNHSESFSENETNV